ncbi:SMP-30/gluconolactonase/LRE family protein [Fuerstiella marisgermanici]|uniref:Gluconolactonase n=1 Tax=Fuerstiella marisgermanici TaxID=1891926 RepID=A0A1P8W8S5_9PLAN|nr:SMP-30/gluconolactonase/LRE family protein [Fuerstiella marisgermanici]APZ90464.1 Gluconolactonase precursor [Fuerstiella marisgermanici]
MPRNQHYSRRQFLYGTGAAVMLSGHCGFAIAKPPDYSGLETDRYLGSVEVLARVQAEKVFTEGPAVDAAGNVLFTNVPASEILKWDPRARKLSVYRDNTNETNGLYFAPNGSLLACEGGAARVTRTDARSGKIEVLADGFNGKPFAKPNDLCMDGRGRIYFTSRSDTQDPAGENVKAVYRIAPDGAVTQILAFPEVHMPNGIVTSPDNKKLYVIEAHPDANHHRDIRVYDLNQDGSVSNGRVLIDFYPGRSGDGMCIDANGNLYVAAGLHKTRNTSETLDTKPGIHVISPDGKLLAFRQTPEDTITNCTFGGPDLKSLYVTCGTLLLRIPTEIPGKPTYRPER